jgi:ornithine cyclodeaminase/alanine dehydrogenase-like protein (mu-crystallin family)
MSFETATISGSSVIGAQRNTWGTFTNSATSGTITTGMKYVNSFIFTASANVGSETAMMTLNSPANGQVAVTVSSGDFTAGNWSAIGYGGG